MGFCCSNPNLIYTGFPASLASTYVSFPSLSAFSHPQLINKRATPRFLYSERVQSISRSISCQCFITFKSSAARYNGQKVQLEKIFTYRDVLLEDSPNSFFSLPLVHQKVYHKELYRSPQAKEGIYPPTSSSLLLPKDPILHTPQSCLSPRLIHLRL